MIELEKEEFLKFTNTFIKNHKIKMHPAGVYLMGKGDLKIFLETYLNEK